MRLQSTAALPTVWISVSDAVDLITNGKLNAVEFPMGGQVEVTITVTGSSQPIYVARDEYEQLTGRSSDGWERFPDALLRKPLEARINGVLALRTDLDAVLDVAGPTEAVTEAREMLAKITEAWEAGPAVVELGRRR